MPPRTLPRVGTWKSTRETTKGKQRQKFGWLRGVHVSTVVTVGLPGTFVISHYLPKATRSTWRSQNTTEKLLCFYLSFFTRIQSIERNREAKKHVYLFSNGIVLLFDCPSRSLSLNTASLVPKILRSSRALCRRTLHIWAFATKDSFH